MPQPDKPGRSIIEAAKKQEKKIKKENNMKTLSKLNPKTWVSHDTFVALKTLFTLALIAALIFAGWHARGEYEASVNHKVQSQVQAALTVAPSKQ